MLKIFQQNLVQRIKFFTKHVKMGWGKGGMGWSSDEGVGSGVRFQKQISSAGNRKDHRTVDMRCECVSARG